MEVTLMRPVTFKLINAREEESLVAIPKEINYRK